MHIPRTHFCNIGIFGFGNCAFIVQQEPWVGKLQGALWAISTKLPLMNWISCICRFMIKLIKKVIFFNYKNLYLLGVISIYGDTAQKTILVLVYDILVQNSREEQAPIPL